MVLVSGCTQGVVFQADVPITNGQWSRSYKPAFEFDISDTTAQHDVYIDLRHTGDYPFSDLFLFVTVTGPGLPLAVDTVECTLADPTGRWYGKGAGYIFADRIKAHVLYKLGKRFPRKGRYSIQLEQAMRVEPLEGVIDVGISVEKSAKTSTSP